MSKGSERIVVRFPADLLAEMQAALERHNDHDPVLWTMSDFIRDCVRERVNKPARRKASAARRKGG